MYRAGMHRAGMHRAAAWDAYGPRLAGPAADDSPLELMSVFGEEWREARGHFEKKDAETPEVRSCAVAPLEQHL